MRIRPARFAGQYYPLSPARLREQVERWLSDHDDAAGSRPLAIVAPHAGYVYSGQLAARAFSTCREGAGSIQRVLMLGTSHHSSAPGLNTTMFEAFETPLGQVEVDRAPIDRLLAEERVFVADRAHLLDHAIEVLLPFMQVLLPEARLLPFVVGPCPADGVARLVEELANEPGTLVVVSTDLSHFLTRPLADALDRETARLVERLDVGAMGRERACGYHALRGVMKWARGRNLVARCLGLRTSADAGASADRVVGYGAFRFDPVAGATTP